MYACKAKLLDMAKLLANKVTSLETRNHNGMCALHFAAGSLGTATMLLRQGASVSAISHQDRSVFQFAVIKRCFPLCKLLVEMNPAMVHEEVGPPCL
jgi:ankyrin repeat protein